MKITRYFASTQLAASQFAAAITQVTSIRDVFLSENATDIEEIVDEDIRFEIIQGYSGYGPGLFAIIKLTYYPKK